MAIRGCRDSDHWVRERVIRDPSQNPWVIKQWLVGVTSGRNSLCAVHWQRNKSNNCLLCQGSGCRLDTAKGCYWGVHRVTVQQLWCIETGNRVVGISMREMLGASLKMTHHANAAFIYCLLVKLGNFKILFVCLSVQYLFS